MNQLFVKLPLILGVVAALSFAGTPGSWAAAAKGDQATAASTKSAKAKNGMAATTKPAKGKKAAAKPAKSKKVAAKPAKGKKAAKAAKGKKVAVAAAKPAAPSYPGSEFTKPAPKVSPIFPYAEPPKKK